MTQWPRRSSDNDLQQEQQVVNFNIVRKQRLDEKRKMTERIFFRNLLSVYSIIGKTQMRPIELIDVSENGCSFQCLFEPENPWPSDSKGIPIRLYFSRDSYLEILVDIQNSRDFIENGMRFIRFGCSVDSTTQSYCAYQQFVRFLKLYSEYSYKDMGDITAFYR